MVTQDAIMSMSNVKINMAMINVSGSDRTAKRIMDNLMDAGVTAPSGWVEYQMCH